MLGTVLKDKEKIEQIIEEPDRYQRDALKTTWEKVNGYMLFPESGKYTGTRRHLRGAPPGELCDVAASRRTRPDGWP